MDFKKPSLVKPVPGFPELFYRKPTLRAYQDDLRKTEFAVWSIRWTVCDESGKFLFDSSPGSLDTIRDWPDGGDVFDAINDDVEAEKAAKEEQKKTSQKQET